MLSLTDMLTDLVRRGLTLRIDPEGNLFIYDPPRAAAKPAEPPNGVTPNGVRMQIIDSLNDDDGGMSARHAAALAARCRRLAPPDPGSVPPPGPQWRGITWQDVPGHDQAIQKLNFSLLKRGLLHGHKCCAQLEGEALKQQLNELSLRNRGNSRVRKEQSQKRKKSRAKKTPRAKPP